MNSNGKKVAVEDEGSFLSRMNKFAVAVVGLFGISGMLYGIGFVIMRSHYSFLGIWGGVPLSSTEVAEEGGRFFYHLIFVPVSLLSSFNLYTVILLVILGIAWDFRSRLFKRMAKDRNPKLNRLRNLLSRMKTLWIIISLAFTMLLMETVWTVTEFNNALLETSTVSPEFASPESRIDLYYHIFWRIVVGVLIALFLYRVFWLRAAAVQRWLIVMQWLIVIAALGTLPMAYGKLMLPTLYRPIQHPKAPPGESLFLLGQTSDTWIIWNATQKQTEILPQVKDDRVTILQREELLK